MEEKNRAEQLVECGNRYSAAGGPEWDDAAARKCYEQAVTLGSPEAACRLSEMLLTGKGGPKDRRRSAQLCKAAAEQGLLQAIYRLGWMYLSGTEGLATDWAEGLKWIEQAARKGCWEAMFDLACMYRDGDFGLEKDCPKAVLWFGAAAEAGMPAAYRHLAELYMWEQWEKDIPEHREEAIRYYHLGAEAGDEECMNRLGLRSCSGGTIWKNDIPAAVEWMRKSAGAGNGDAMLLLGELYEREWDGLFGREISAYWSCRGAKAGSRDAWQALRDSHWPQTGFARDIEEAHTFVCALTARYYRWAAEAGDAVAMNNLGVAYETGQGVEQDELQAMYWYDQAAGHGLGTAVENLGWRNLSWKSLTREAALAALVRLRSGGTYTLGLAREHRTIDESRYGEKALRWYSNSPGLHTPEGMRIIGWCCDHGRYDMVRDGVAAAQWYL